MACPACLGTSVLVSQVCSYFGINVPTTPKGKCISFISNAVLTALTVYALKVFANISACGTYGFSLKGMGLIVLKTIPLTIIYSIMVNSLLGHFRPDFFVKPSCTCATKDTPSSCCCSKNN